MLKLIKAGFSFSLILLLFISLTACAKTKQETINERILCSNLRRVNTQGRPSTKVKPVEPKLKKRCLEVGINLER